MADKKQQLDASFRILGESHRRSVLLVEKVDSKNILFLCSSKASPGTEINMQIIHLEEKINLVARLDKCEPIDENHLWVCHYITVSLENLRRLVKLNLNTG